MNTASKILELPALLKTVAQWQASGEKIVFSNGCFDLVHLGHVDYLEKARNLGDRLVLGLNTDQSVRELKGEERPFVEEYARARVLAAFEFVDGLTFFSEPTPYELIKAIQPNILVKGSDYNIENIVGADIVMANGGEVKTIDLVEGFSTTQLMKKIRGGK